MCLRNKSCFQAWLFVYVTPRLTLKKLTFCPQRVFMCCACISDQTTISLFNSYWLVFVTETEYVYCAVWSEYLNVISKVLLWCWWTGWRCISYWKTTVGTVMQHNTLPLRSVHCVTDPSFRLHVKLSAAEILSTCKARRTFLHSPTNLFRLYVFCR